MARSRVLVDGRFKSAQQLLEEHNKGEHPFAFLCRVMNDDANDLNIRVKCAGLLLDYTLPKQKAIEHNVHVDRDIQAYWEGEAIEHKDPEVPTLSSTKILEHGRRQLI